MTAPAHVLLCVPVGRCHLINGAIRGGGGRWLKLTVITGSGDRKPGFWSVAVNPRAAAGFGTTVSMKPSLTNQMHRFYLCGVFLMCKDSLKSGTSDHCSVKYSTFSPCVALLLLLAGAGWETAAFFFPPCLLWFAGCLGDVFKDLWFLLRSVPQFQVLAAPLIGSVGIEWGIYYPTCPKEFTKFTEKKSALLRCNSTFSLCGVTFLLTELLHIYWECYSSLSLRELEYF